MFVVLRGDEDTNYLVPIADQLMGHNARPYREAQKRWKGLLRDRVEKLGIERSVDELQRLGCSRANLPNLLNWLSSRNIATAEQADFLALMEFCGIGQERQEYWQIARYIRSHHISAGHMIRRRLLEVIETTDLSETSRLGKIDFELPDLGGGKLTAYRIEWRSPDLSYVSTNSLERLIKGDG
jgi:hypothetical protein